MAIETSGNCEKADLREISFHVVESNRDRPFPFLVTCLCVADATVLYGTEAEANAVTRL